MAELKTKKTDASVKKFLDTITDEQRRRDCLVVSQLMEEITGAKPKMWGPGIVGFGDYHYRYESGWENDWFPIGFSPRKQSLTLYCMSGFGKQADLMKRLGKHKIGKGCLYINKLEEIDLSILKALLTKCLQDLKK